MKHSIYIILILVLGQCNTLPQKTDYTTSPHLEKFIDKGYSPLPCFPSPKINTILQQHGDSTKTFPTPIPDKSYNSLTNQEKIIYALEHPESYGQVCSVSRVIKGTSNKIMGSLPMFFTWSRMSKRQREHLKNNRDSTIVYLKKCINQSTYVSQRYKDLILEFDFYECIPALINKIEQPGQYDTQILTTLMLFMKYNKYTPFLESKIHEKLYKLEEGKFFRDRKKFIRKKDKTIQEVIELANAFYQEKMKQ